MIMLFTLETQRTTLNPGVTLLTAMQLLLEQVLTPVIMDTFPFLKDKCRDITHDIPPCLITLLIRVCVVADLYMPRCASNLAP